MIDAKDAHYLTNEAITRNKLKALNAVEVRIKNAIDEGEFKITVDDIFLNNSCVEFLKENGYKLEYFSMAYDVRTGCKAKSGYIISW